MYSIESRQFSLDDSQDLEVATHLDIAVGPRDDINALTTLLILQDAGVVLRCQDKQQVLVLPLEFNIMLSKQVLLKNNNLF